MCSPSTAGEGGEARPAERSLSNADPVVFSLFSGLALGTSSPVSHYASSAECGSSFDLHLERMWTTNYDVALEAAISPRDNIDDDFFTGCQEQTGALWFNTSLSFPETPPTMQVADLHFTPSQTRRWHDATRAATALEQTSFHHRLYLDETSWSWCSSADASDLIKLLSGRTPRQRSGDVNRDHARLHSLWAEVREILRSARQVAPPSMIARGGRQALIGALKSARARVLSRRTKLPPTPSALVSCAAANAALEDDIMRHGPPVAPCKSGPRPGSEPPMIV